MNAKESLLTAVPLFLSLFGFFVSPTTGKNIFFQFIVASLFLFLFIFVLNYSKKNE